VLAAWFRTHSVPSQCKRPEEPELAPPTAQQFIADVHVTASIEAELLKIEVNTDHELPSQCSTSGSTSELAKEAPVAQQSKAELQAIPFKVPLTAGELTIDQDEPFHFSIKGLIPLVETLPTAQH
jgi:hypothetical protein